MDHYQTQLHDYITQHLQHGTPPASIHQSLIGAGWNPAMVASSMRQALGLTAPQPAQQPAQARDIPQKYGVFRSIKDSFRAIRRNPIPFLLSSIVSIVAIAIISTVFFSIAGAFLFGFFFSQGTTGRAVLMAGASFTLINSIWYAVCHAILVVMQSLPVYDGAENRTSAIKQILQVTKQRSLRVLGANFLLGVVVTGPLVIISLLMLIATFITRGSSSAIGVLFIGFLLQMGAVVWMIIALLRYSLMPYIAIFEDIPLKQTVARSFHLTRKGGQWFLFKGFMLLLLVVIIIAAATGNDIKELNNTANVFIFVILSAVTVLVNSCLVMLYRNRRIIRGSAS